MADDTVVIQSQCGGRCALLRDSSGEVAALTGSNILLMRPAYENTDGDALLIHALNVTKIKELLGCEAVEPLSGAVGSSSIANRQTTSQGVIIVTVADPLTSRLRAFTAPVGRKDDDRQWLEIVLKHPVYAPLGNELSITQVVCGVAHAHVLDDRNRVWSWGRNGDGELGVGDTQSRDDPTLITLFEPEHMFVRQLIAGPYSSGCIADDQELGAYGQFYSWGECASDSDGRRLDLNSPKLFIEAGVMSAGLGWGCFLAVVDGDLYVCGRNEDNCLGMPLEHYLEPVRHPDSAQFAAQFVACGYNVSCILSQNEGRVFVAGNANNHLASGTGWREMQLPQGGAEQLFVGHDVVVVKVNGVWYSPKKLDEAVEVDSAVSSLLGNSQVSFDLLPRSALSGGLTKAARH